MKGTEMEFEKLQKEIFEILQEGLSEFCGDTAKGIADMVMRRMDIPDSHVMRMGIQAMEIDRLKARISELEEKLGGNRLMSDCLKRKIVAM